MRKSVKYLLYTVIFLVFICLTGLYALDRFFSGMCGNEIIVETFSPDKQNKAVLFQRDCGATTGFSTQISIINAKKNLPKESGNVFIADGHPDDSNVKLQWLSPKKISIEIGLKKKVFKNEHQLNGIEIIYR